VGGSHADALAVAVAAAPHEGQANLAVCEAVAEALGVPRRAVELVAGPRGRRKRLRAVGPPDRLRQRVLELARGFDGPDPGS
jgi:hypothetical protein